MSQFDLYETINEATGENVNMKQDGKGGDSYNVNVGTYQIAKGLSKALANEVVKIVKKNPNKYKHK
jgi:hypothetical protein